MAGSAIDLCTGLLRHISVVYLAREMLEQHCSCRSEFEFISVSKGLRESRLQVADCAWGWPLLSCRAKSAPLLNDATDHCLESAHRRREEETSRLA